MLLRNVWAFIKKMSIKVISLILIAFLARNCYKYIINYKSVDFDNSYITPMFMRKEGVDKRFVWTRKFTDPILQDARRKRQGKPYVFPLRCEFLLRKSVDIIRFQTAWKNWISSPLVTENDSSSKAKSYHADRTVHGIFHVTSQLLRISYDVTPKPIKLIVYLYWW